MPTTTLVMAAGEALDVMAAATIAPAARATGHTITTSCPSTALLHAVEAIHHDQAAGRVASHQEVVAAPMPHLQCSIMFNSIFLIVIALMSVDSIAQQTLACRTGVCHAPSRR